MTTDLSSLSPGDAEQLLNEISQVRRQTRSRLGEHTWMGFLVWAAVFAGAAIVGGRIPWYWGLAVPAALAVTALIEARTSSHRSVCRGESRYWLIGGAITVLCFGGGLLLSPPVQAAWVWIVLGLGFAGFAILEYHREAAALLVGLSLVALLAGVTVTDPEIVYRGMGVLFAAAMALLARRMKP